MDFNKTYKSRESLYDTNEYFAHGETLIFVRFAAGFQVFYMCSFVLFFRIIILR